MQFEYYVLNYDFNKKKVINYNIFNNILVQERTEKAVKKYLRAPKNFKYIVQYANKFLNREEIVIYGFNALVKEIDSIIHNQQWSRREYEISVGDAFETDCTKLVKRDCYQQCKPNMVAITHEVIRQYKEQLKKEKVIGN